MYGRIGENGFEPMRGERDAEGRYVLPGIETVKAQGYKEVAMATENVQLTREDAQAGKRVRIEYVEAGDFIVARRVVK